MADAGLRVAVAESFTGGRILDAITNVPGASRILQGGIVAYHDDVKVRVLGVPRATLEAHGAVSGPTARSMAEGVRRRLHADIGLSSTGIAGPGGATPRKPVGLSFVGLADARTSTAERHVHHGTRVQVKTQATQQAFAVLDEALARLPRSRAAPRRHSEPNL